MHFIGEGRLALNEPKDLLFFYPLISWILEIVHSVVLLIALHRLLRHPVVLLPIVRGGEVVGKIREFDAVRMPIVTRMNIDRLDHNPLHFLLTYWPAIFRFPPSASQSCPPPPGQSVPPFRLANVFQYLQSL
jgi:hypothetical protein